jgi:hypothetical protein
MKKRDQVYALLGQGLRPKQIAVEMGISQHAVYHHMASMRDRPDGRDLRVLRKPKARPQSAAKRELAVQGKRWGKGRDEFFRALGSSDVAIALIDDTPPDMTVTEYIAKIVLDVYVEDA